MKNFTFPLLQITEWTSLLKKQLKILKQCIRFTGELIDFRNTHVNRYPTDLPGQDVQNVCYLMDTTATTTTTAFVLILYRWNIYSFLHT